MKKKAIISVIIICAMIFTPFVSVYAQAAETQQDNVYASVAEQERIYKIAKETCSHNKLLDNCNVEILKESISPVYGVDMLEYAKTDEFKPESAKAMYNKSENKQYMSKESYIAKLVHKSDGRYAGNIRFGIDDDQVRGTSCEIIPEFNVLFQNESWNASCSYADHANRIKNMLGLSEIVPPENVKFMLINYVGYFFYVTVGEESYLIPLGRIYKEGKAPASVWGDRVIPFETIKKEADRQLKDHEDYLKAKAEWEATHPGEEYSSFGGSSSQSITVSIGEIDNINNIREYLGMEMGEPVSTSSDENNASSYSYLIIPAAVVAVALVIAVAVIVLKKKKQAKASDISEQEPLL